MDATLVVMAAGIGSRFGGGIKQLEPVGPNGEIIMDYSIYDAMEAGFNKVVFIIRHDLEKDFKEIIGDRISKHVKVEYAFQELTEVPSWYKVPADRKKPLGTGHAILCCKDLVHEPFAVINADDYYGKEGFQVIYDYMQKQEGSGDKLDMCMAGFILKNTLSENGGVTRGVCCADENGYLTDVQETFEVYMDSEGKMHAVDGKGAPRQLTPDDIVSMNLWGLDPGIFGLLETGFDSFLKSLAPDELKAEYLLPTVISGAIKDGKGTVKVLESHDKWFGVTYKEDKPVVVESIKALIASGKYPAKLYG